MNRGVAVSLLLAALAPATAAWAGGAGPSFDCRKARLPDEKTICADPKLAELDQAIAIAYAKVPAEMRSDAKSVMQDDLKDRRACGSNRLCILDHQVDQLATLQDDAVNAPVPAWVGSYRLALFKQSGMTPTDGLPTQLGQCTMSKITRIGTRFGQPLKPPSGPMDSSGSAVLFANGGIQISYDFVAPLAESKVGDEVLICLLSLPQNCPPGDDRGKVYVTTDTRTGGTWSMPDSQHMCGGA
jgi:uncharacterized protein